MQGDYRHRILCIIDQFRAVLDTREDLLRCLCKYGVQREGWFSAEMLCFLDRIKGSGRVGDFDREVRTGVGGSKVDVKIDFAGPARPLIVWIELKHWLIGYQRDEKFNCGFYFGERGSAGIKPDAMKLVTIPETGRFILVLCTANPGEGDWTSGVDKFNSKFHPFHVEALTRPGDFPDFYYLGLLEVRLTQGASDPEE